MAHRSRALSRGALLLAAGLVAAAFALASAQSPLKEPVAAALAEAEASLRAAVQTPLYRAATPDDAPWHAAITAATHALSLAKERRDAAPEDEESFEDWQRAQLLMARSYALANWHSRAFQAFTAYMNEAGPPSNEAVELRGADGTLVSLPSDLHLMVTALNQLGFARYSAGDLDGAHSYYLTVLDLDPGQPEALRWLARIASEQGDYAAAATAWRHLQEVTPDDPDVAYFLALAVERERFGAPASDAYRLGISLYQQGELAAALTAFDDAYRYNPELIDALAWSGRVALDLGQPDRAASYWRSVLRESPEDERAAYFLEVAESQLQWGAAAGGAYFEGQAAYARGELEEALAAFQTATEANERFVDAWVWAARTSQELGKARQAVGLWQEVLRLDPNDERARWFLQAAQQELAHGPEAGSAFTAGLEAYRHGDVQTAQEQFRLAVEAEPAFAMAWGYLGRISFQAGAYQDAAEAYARATELEPDNDDYAFFAAEASRLTEPSD